MEIRKQFQFVPVCYVLLQGLGCTGLRADLGFGFREQFQFVFDFAMFGCLTEAAKPEEEAVNERKENFVSLADVLDDEHDPQISR